MNHNAIVEVESLYLKKNLIKAVSNIGLAFVDVFDLDDMEIKLQTLGELTSLGILEVYNENLVKIKASMKLFRQYCPKVPVIALVYKETADIVSVVLQLGIEDILLLPQNQNLYSKSIQDKLNKYRIVEPEKEVAAVNRKIIHENADLSKELQLELKRAERGDYSFSLVLAHLVGGSNFELFREFINSLEPITRDTDRIFIMDDNTFLSTFPFSSKEHILIIEEKIREAFKTYLPKIGLHKKLSLYSATYPNDGNILEELLSRLEKGINNSIVINSVHTPLSSLSKSEIENYKKMIKQYKRFFYF